MKAGAEKAGRSIDADFPVGGGYWRPVVKTASEQKDATRRSTGTYVVNKSYATLRMT